MSPCRHLLLLCFYAVALVANPQVDALFKAYDSPTVPGASVGIFRNNTLVYERGYGLADVENKKAATPETNYRIASLSKQFTAMAILRLVEWGLLSLDRRLTEVFPEFPAYGAKITVRHLLNHTGGLRDYEDLIPAGQTQQLSDADVLRLLAAQSSPKFSAGDQYSYSNSGYVLLGLIVERTANMNFAQFITCCVLGPLHLDKSLMYDGPQTAIENRAYGYSPQGSGFVRTDQSITSATRGDGGIYTSVRDWATWDRAWDEPLLISTELQRLAFTPGKLNNGSLTSYGFGWMLSQNLQEHTGSTIGFRTAVQRTPSKKLTVVVLVNRANSAPWDTASRISSLYP